MMNEVLAAAIVLAIVAGATIVLTPLARALARRIDGRSRGTEQRLSNVEAVLADLQDDHHRVEMLEERLTRSSRQARSTSHRRRSERPARSTEPPKVGKLWMPPPYDA
jgi:hypothetical protein